MNSRNKPGNEHIATSIEVRLDEIINQAITSINLSERHGHHSGRYRAAGVVAVLEALHPYLIEAKLLSADYQIPSLQCCRCLGEPENQEGHPNHRCRLLDRQLPSQPPQDWNNCRMRLHHNPNRWINPTDSASDEDCGISTSQNCESNNDKS